MSRVRWWFSMFAAVVLASACGSASPPPADPAASLAAPAHSASVETRPELAATLVDVRCTSAGATVTSDRVRVDPPGAVAVKIRNETATAIIVRLAGQAGTTDGKAIEAGTTVDDQWDVSPGAYGVQCATSGSVFGRSATLTFVGSTPDTGPCVGFAVRLAETAVGIGLDAIPARVRALIGNLRESDEISAPDETSGSTATWRVIRDGRSVAQVTFVNAPGHGWLAESGSACEGLTIRPN